MDSGALPPNWADRLVEVVVGEETEALDADWVVAYVDPVSGATVYSGPYPSGVEAMAVIEWERDRQARRPDAEWFRFELVRLHGPTKIAD